VDRQSNGFHTRDPILTQVCFLRHSAGKMLVGQQAERVCGSAATWARGKKSRYAPHEHGQHLCHRVLPVACCGFLAVADIKCDVGGTPRLIPRVIEGKA
jgi:hypothetical protein